MRGSRANEAILSVGGQPLTQQAVALLAAVFILVVVLFVRWVEGL